MAGREIATRRVARALATPGGASYSAELVALSAGDGPQRGGVRSRGGSVQKKTHSEFVFRPTLASCAKPTPPSGTSRCGGGGGGARDRRSRFVANCRFSADFWLSPARAERHRPSARGGGRRRENLVELWGGDFFRTCRDSQNRRPLRCRWALQPGFCKASREWAQGRIFFDLGLVADWQVEKLRLFESRGVRLIAKKRPLSADRTGPRK
mgnify:CR=1 FL=1